MSMIKGFPQCLFIFYQEVVHISLFDLTLFCSKNLGTLGCSSLVCSATKINPGHVFVSKGCLVWTSQDLRGRRVNGPDFGPCCITPDHMLCSVSVLVQGCAHRDCVKRDIIRTNTLIPATNTNSLKVQLVTQQNLLLQFIQAQLGVSEVTFESTLGFQYHRAGHFLSR